MTIDQICSLLKGVKGNGHKRTALCPAHDDRNPSLSISEADGKVLLRCFAGCPTESVIAAIRLEYKDLFNENGVRSLDWGDEERPNRTVTIKNGSSNSSTGSAGLVDRTPTAFYDYTEPDGTVRFQIVRYEAIGADGETQKTFRARRKPGEGEKAGNDGWIYNLNSIETIPYNLPEISIAALVYIVEGEKDVETLRSIGLPATCNPFGAGKWRQEFGRWLSGRTAVILPDNDDPGKLHAQAVAEMLNGITQETLLIEIPGLPPNGDVTDFIESGGTADDLMDLVLRADSYMPASTSAERPLSKFTFTPLNKLLAEPAEAISFVWDKTLPTGGFSICSSKPKVGKSTLARNLAIAVATGADFLGRNTVVGRVIYLALEEKRAEIQSHFERMGVSSNQILVYTGKTPENAIAEIGFAVAEQDPILVIIDPLSRVVRAGDFNDYGQMTRALEPIIDLARRSGSHVLALHHDSKMGREGGEALLGSTAFFGAVDCHIQMRKKDGKRVLLTTQRYGEDMAETLIELENETGLVIGAGSLKDHLQARVKELVMDVLFDNEEQNEATIKSGITGFNLGVIAKALRELVEEGKVVRSGEGKRGKPYLYRVPNTSEP